MVDKRVNKSTESIVIQHASARSQCYLIPQLSKPFILRRTGEVVPYNCGACGGVHLCSTLHLWLDGDGKCIATTDILPILEKTGETGFTLVGAVDAPPPIELTLPRQLVDQQNAAIMHSIVKMARPIDNSNSVDALEPQGALTNG